MDRRSTRNPRIFLKALALTTLAIFLFTDTLFFPSQSLAATGTAIFLGGQNTRDLSASAQAWKDRVPPELGKIDEVYFPTIDHRPQTRDQRPQTKDQRLKTGLQSPVSSLQSAKTIVFVQDAHDSLEAQQNIAKIITHLVANYGVKTVFEEGFEGKVPTDEFFGFIKDPALKEKTASFFLDHLRIGGAEFAHINRFKSEILNPKFEVISNDKNPIKTNQKDSNLGSVSDFELRNSNFKKDGGAEYAHINRRSRLNQRPETRDQRLKAVERVPSPESRVPDFNLIGADSLKLHKKGIRDYRESEKSRMGIQKDLNALEGELKTLIFGRLPGEFKKWLKEKERFARAEISPVDYLARSVEYAKPETLASLKQIRMLMEMAACPHLADRVQGIGYSKNAASKELSPKPYPLNPNAIDPLELFREMEALEDGITAAWLVTGDERQVFYFYQNVLLLKKLSEVKVSDAEFEALKKRFAGLTTRKIGEQISRIAGKPLVLSKRWETRIQSALDFYETAAARDRSIETQLDKFLAAGLGARDSRFDGRETQASPEERETSPAPAVLVYGGFHKENIKRILKEKGFNYVIVSPTITAPSPRHEAFYKKLMTLGRHDFEASLALRTASRALPVFAMGEFGRSEVRAVYDQIASGIAIKDVEISLVNAARRSETREVQRVEWTPEIQETILRYFKTPEASLEETRAKRQRIAKLIQAVAIHKPEILTETPPIRYQNPETIVSQEMERFLWDFSTMRPMVEGLEPSLRSEYAPVAQALEALILRPDKPEKSGSHPDFTQTRSEARGSEEDEGDGEETAAIAQSPRLRDGALSAVLGLGRPLVEKLKLALSLPGLFRDMVRLVKTGKTPLLKSHMLKVLYGALTGRVKLVGRKVDVLDPGSEEEKVLGAVDRAIAELVFIKDGTYVKSNDREHRGQGSQLLHRNVKILVGMPDTGEFVLMRSPRKDKKRRTAKFFGGAVESTGREEDPKQAYERAARLETAEELGFGPGYELQGSWEYISEVGESLEDDQKPWEARRTTVFLYVPSSGETPILRERARVLAENHEANGETHIHSLRRLRKSSNGDGEVLELLFAKPEELVDSEWIADKKVSSNTLRWIAHPAVRQALAEAREKSWSHPDIIPRSESRFSPKTTPGVVLGPGRSEARGKVRDRKPEPWTATGGLFSFGVLERYIQQLLRNGAENKNPWRFRASLWTLTPEQRAKLKSQIPPNPKNDYGGVRDHLRNLVDGGMLRYHAAMELWEGLQPLARKLLLNGHAGYFSAEAWNKKNGDLFHEMLRLAGRFELEAHGFRGWIGPRILKDFTNEWALLSTMVEGRLTRGYVGPLASEQLYPDPSQESSLFGPYFLILKKNAKPFFDKALYEKLGRPHHPVTSLYSEWAYLPASEHLLYLVPNDAAKNFIKAGIKQAVSHGFMKANEAKERLSKLITYEELLKIGDRMGDVLAEKLTPKQALARSEARSETRSGMQARSLELRAEEVDAIVRFFEGFNSVDWIAAPYEHNQIRLGWVWSYVYAMGARFLEKARQQGINTEDLLRRIKEYWVWPPKGGFAYWPSSKPGMELSGDEYDLLNTLALEVRENRTWLGRHRELFDKYVRESAREQIVTRRALRFLMPGDMFGYQAVSFLDEILSLVSESGLSRDQVSIGIVSEDLPEHIRAVLSGKVTFTADEVEKFRHPDLFEALPLQSAFVGRRYRLSPLALRYITFAPLDLTTVRPRLHAARPFDFAFIAGTLEYLRRKDPRLLHRAYLYLANSLRSGGKLFCCEGVKTAWGDAVGGELVNERRGPLRLEVYDREASAFVYTRNGKNFGSKPQTHLRFEKSGSHPDFTETRSEARSGPEFTEEELASMLNNFDEDTPLVREIGDIKTVGALAEAVARSSKDPELRARLTRGVHWVDVIRMNLYEGEAFSNITGDGAMVIFTAQWLRRRERSDGGTLAGARALRSAAIVAQPVAGSRRRYEIIRKMNPKTAAAPIRDLSRETEAQIAVVNAVLGGTPETEHSPAVSQAPDKTREIPAWKIDHAGIRQLEAWQELESFIRAASQKAGDPAGVCGTLYRAIIVSHDPPGEPDSGIRTESAGHEVFLGLIRGFFERHLGDYESIFGEATPEFIQRWTRFIGEILDQEEKTLAKLAQAKKRDKRSIETELTALRLAWGEEVRTLMISLAPEEPLELLLEGSVEESMPEPAPPIIEGVAAVAPEEVLPVLEPAPAEESLAKGATVPVETPAAEAVIETADEAAHQKTPAAVEAAAPAPDEPAALPGETAEEIRISIANAKERVKALYYAAVSHPLSGAKLTDWPALDHEDPDDLKALADFENMKPEDWDFGTAVVWSFDPYVAGLNAEIPRNKLARVQKRLAQRTVLPVAARLEKLRGLDGQPGLTEFRDGLVRDLRAVADSLMSPAQPLEHLVRVPGVRKGEIAVRAETRGPAAGLSRRWLRFPAARYFVNAVLDFSALHALHAFLAGSNLISAGVLLFEAGLALASGGVLMTAARIKLLGDNRLLNPAAERNLRSHLPEPFAVSIARAREDLVREAGKFRDGALIVVTGGMFGAGKSVIAYYFYRTLRDIYGDAAVFVDEDEDPWLDRPEQLSSYVQRLKKQGRIVVVSGNRIPGGLQKDGGIADTDRIFYVRSSPVSRALNQRVEGVLWAFATAVVFAVLSFQKGLSPFPQNVIGLIPAALLVVLMLNTSKIGLELIGDPFLEHEHRGRVRPDVLIANDLGDRARASGKIPSDILSDYQAHLARSETRQDILSPARASEARAETREPEAVLREAFSDDRLSLEVFTSEDEAHMSFSEIMEKARDGESRDQKTLADFNLKHRQGAREFILGFRDRFHEIQSQFPAGPLLPSLSGAGRERIYEWLRENFDAMRFFTREGRSLSEPLSGAQIRDFADAVMDAYRWAKGKRSYQIAAVSGDTEDPEKEAWQRIEEEEESAQFVGGLASMISDSDDEGIRIADALSNIQHESIRDYFRAWYQTPGIDDFLKGMLLSYLSRDYYDPELLPWIEDEIRRKPDGRSVRGALEALAQYHLDRPEVKQFLIDFASRHLIPALELLDMLVCRLPLREIPPAWEQAVRYYDEEMPEGPVPGLENNVFRAEFAQRIIALKAFFDFLHRHPQPFVYRTKGFTVRFDRTDTLVLWGPDGKEIAKVSFEINAANEGTEDGEETGEDEDAEENGDDEENGTEDYRYDFDHDLSLKYSLREHEMLDKGSKREILEILLAACVLAAHEGPLEPLPVWIGTIPEILAEWDPQTFAGLPIEKFRVTSRSEVRRAGSEVIEKISGRELAHDKPFIAVFDVHGTLLVPTWKVEFVRAYREMTGSDLESAIAWVEDHAIEDLNVKLAERTGRPLREVKEVVARYRDLGQRTSRPQAIPGALEMVRALRDKGVPVVIQSASPREIVIAQLAKTGFLELVPEEMIVTRDEMMLSREEGARYSVADRENGLRSIQRHFPHHTLLHFNDKAEGFKVGAKELGGYSFGLPQGEGPEKESNLRDLREGGADFMVPRGLGDWHGILEFLAIDETLQKKDRTIPVFLKPAEEIPLILPAHREPGLKLHIDVHSDPLDPDHDFETLTYSKVKDDTGVFRRDGSVDYRELKLEKLETFPSSFLLSPMSWLETHLAAELYQKIRALWDDNTRYTTYRGVTVSWDGKLDKDVWTTNIDTVLLQQRLEDSGVLPKILRHVPEPRVHELGVGGGAIITSIAMLMRDLGKRLKEISFSDISTYALRTAKRNIMPFLAKGTRVRTFLGQGLGNLSRKLDLLVVNPPYIPTLPNDPGAHTDPYRGTGLIREVMERGTGYLNPENPEASILINISSLAGRDWERYLELYGENLEIEAVGKPLKVPLKIGAITDEWKDWLVGKGLLEKIEHPEPGQEPYWHTLQVYRIRPKVLELFSDPPVGKYRSETREGTNDGAARLESAKSIDEAMKIILENYPEMNWLTGDVHATPEGVSGTGASYVSERLFGKKHIEFDRTATGIMAFLWVVQDHYEKFTECQPEKVRLTRKSFEELRAYTLGILRGNPEALRAVIVYALMFDALIAYTVINDLGKIESVVDLVRKEYGAEEADHDKILAYVLESHPEFSPSFYRLPQAYKDLILRGLKAVFNFGQFIQAENVPASLQGLVGLDKAALDFYLLHVLYDIAGAAGHVKQNGSMIVTEPVFQGFKHGVAALEKIAEGEGLEEVYDRFLAARAGEYGLDIRDPVQRAVARISLMLRLSDPEKVREVAEVFKKLSSNERAILVSELNVAGVDDGYAVLLYYAPAVLANAQTFLQANGAGSEAFATGVETVLKAFARIYQEARIALKARKGSGVFIVNVADLAELAKTDPAAMNEKAFDLHAVGEDAKLVLKEPARVREDGFPKLKDLSSVSGKKIALIGIGGGSDSLQAAVLGKLFRRAGKEISAVVSIRTAKTGSAGGQGKTGEERTIKKHGGEIFPGVFRVLPASEGSGRFLENIPAPDFPVFLVIDREDGTLAAQIRSVLEHAGGADSVFAVDTGGDALFSISSAEVDASQATPDQDVRVLKVLPDLKVPAFTVEIAAGVDIPGNAEEVLRAARASFYAPSPAEVQTVLGTYRAWGMDEGRENRYGKTALAWQAALQGKEGFQCLPLPEKIVLSKSHPWDPFVHISRSMRGLFIMSLEDHLRAISSPDSKPGFETRFRNWVSNRNTFEAFLAAAVPARSETRETELTAGERARLAPKYRTLREFLVQYEAWRKAHPEKILLLLARHVQSTSNLFQTVQSNLTFSPPTFFLGYRQGRALTRFIRDAGIFFDKVISSALERAHYTVGGVAKAQRIPHEIFRRLNELGSHPLGGISRREILKEYLPLVTFMGRDPELYELPNFSGRTVTANLRKLFREIETGKDRNILIGTHGRTLRLILEILLGISPSKETAVAKRIGSAPNVSLTALSFDPKTGAWELEALMDDSYLPASLRTEQGGKKQALNEAPALFFVEKVVFYARALFRIFARLAGFEGPKGLSDFQPFLAPLLPPTAAQWKVIHSMYKRTLDIITKRYGGPDARSEARDPAADPGSVEAGKRELLARIREFAASSFSLGDALMKQNRGHGDRFHSILMRQQALVLRGLWPSASEERVKDLLQRIHALSSALIELQDELIPLYDRKKALLRPLRGTAPGDTEIRDEVLAGVTFARLQEIAIACEELMVEIRLTARDFTRRLEEDNLLMDAFEKEVSVVEERSPAPGAEESRKLELFLRIFSLEFRYSSAFQAFEEKNSVLMEWIRSINQKLDEFQSRNAQLPSGLKELVREMNSFSLPWARLEEETEAFEEEEAGMIQSLFRTNRKMIELTNAEFRDATLPLLEQAASGFERLVERLERTMAGEDSILEKKRRILDEIEAILASVKDDPGIARSETRAGEEKQTPPAFLMPEGANKKLKEIDRLLDTNKTPAQWDRFFELFAEFIPGSGPYTVSRMMKTLNALKENGKIASSYSPHVFYGIRGDWIGKNMRRARNEIGETRRRILLAARDLQGTGKPFSDNELAGQSRLSPGSIKKVLKLTPELVRKIKALGYIPPHQQWTSQYEADEAEKLSKMEAAADRIRSRRGKGTPISLEELAAESGLTFAQVTYRTSRGDYGVESRDKVLRLEDIRDAVRALMTESGPGGVRLMTSQEVFSKLVAGGVPTTAHNLYTFVFRHKKQGNPLTAEPGAFERMEMIRRAAGISEKDLVAGLGLPDVQAYRARFAKAGKRPGFQRVIWRWEIEDVAALMVRDIFGRWGAWQRLRVPVEAIESAIVHFILMGEEAFRKKHPDMEAVLQEVFSGRLAEEIRNAPFRKDPGVAARQDEAFEMRVKVRRQIEDGLMNSFLTDHMKGIRSRKEEDRSLAEKDLLSLFVLSASLHRDFWDRLSDRGDIGERIKNLPRYPTLVSAKGLRVLQKELGGLRKKFEEKKAPGSPESDRLPVVMAKIERRFDELEAEIVRFAQSSQFRGVWTSSRAESRPAGNRTKSDGEAGTVRAESRQPSHNPVLEPGYGGKKWGSGRVVLRRRTGRCSGSRSRWDLRW